MNAVQKVELSPLRVGRITGSRVGAILGLNPYSKREDVLREMVREALGAEREFKGNEATAYGEAHEADALALYEEQHGVMTYGGGELLIHPEHDFLAVTPDGLVGDDGMVECKAPYRAKYTHWDQVSHYTAQMRLQMACAGRQWCDFVVWRDGMIHVSRITHQPEWLDAVMPDLRSFMDDYHAALKAPEAHLSDKAVTDESAAWARAAEAYHRASFDLQCAERTKEEARAALLELAQKHNAKTVQGFGVSVTRSERAGSIAYAKAIKELLPDADLSKYAGKPTTVFTIKEI